MKPYRSLLYFSFLIAMGLSFAYVRPALAKSKVHEKPVPAATQIILVDPGGIHLGKPFMLKGVLEDQSGNAIASKSISFSIDGQYLGQAPTAGNGAFQLKVSTNINAGTHLISASFKGAHLLSPTKALLSIKVQPSVVRIQTVPAIPGITFQMDGRQFVSDEKGAASIQIYRAADYRLDVLIDKYQDPSRKIEFGRWADESYQPYSDINVPNDGVVQVGLNVYHQVSLSFVDLDGFPVDPQRISGITIRSAQGDVFNLKDGQPRWIPASRVARRQTGLEETQLLYSVISVTIDGSNVVNQNQQRFYAHPNDNWKISLLLYSLHVDAQDGMFGSPVGKAISLEYPDGQVRSYALSRAGSVDIHSLARGIYHVELLGANGMKTNTPVALSRNQDVHIKMITTLDMVVFTLFGVLLALGLLIYGRPWLVRKLFTRTPVKLEKVRTLARDS